MAFRALCDTTTWASSLVSSFASAPWLYCCSSAGLCFLHLSTSACGSPSARSTSLRTSTLPGFFLPPHNPQAESSLWVNSVQTSASCWAPASLSSLLGSVCFDFRELSDIRVYVSGILESPCPAQSLIQSWCRNVECIKIWSGQNMTGLKERGISARGTQEMAPAEGLWGGPNSDSSTPSLLQVSMTSATPAQAEPCRAGVSVAT